MKKIVFIAALASIFNLQFSICHGQGDYGVKVGLGAATIQDDLGSKSPVLGAVIGGYVDFTFAKSQSILGEIFYLQTGLNIVRKGSNYQDELDHGTTMMIRTGYYHSYYAQVPILACVHMELPIRKAGHTVGLFLGPTVNVGLFGRYADRTISPGISSYYANYDYDITGTASDRAVFNHINRFDIGALFGATYEHKNFTLSLYIDRGFMATSEGEDILRIIENNQQANNPNYKPITVKIPNGNNISYMLALSYRLGNF